MSNILVTGASRGIGRATAQAFAERGDRVAVHYGSNEPDAQDTLRSLAGTGHILVAGDLSDAQAALTIVDRAWSEFGGVDILVNNAGAAPSVDNRHRIGETSFDQWSQTWDTMIAVNLLGAVHATWAVATRLIEASRPGSVVNVGSRGASRGEPDYPAYGATKAALQAFGQSIAVSLAPHGIAVTSVAPGFVATERQLSKLSGSEGEALRAQSPFGRVATPAEVARAIVYLADKDSQWASGAILDLNGASYLR